MKKFSLTRFKAVFIKELIQIRRDRASLIMALVAPVMMLLLFGYAVNTDIDHLPTVVWDQTKTAESRDFISALKNSTFINPDFSASGYKQITDYLDSGNAKVAIIIPPQYGRSIQGGEQGNIQVLVDGSDPTVARAAMSAVQLVGINKAWQLQAQRMQSSSGPLALPIQVESRVWYNPDMKSLVFNIPGLIGLILQNIIALLTAFAMVREKERGTMEQLIVTPIQSSELLLGKLLPYVMIGFVSLMLILTLGIYWFGVVPKGSILLLILLSALFLVTVLSIGLLISTISKTQLQAMQMTVLLILPSILLSGFLFPRETMPLALQIIGAFLPLTYFLEIVRGIFLKGIGLEYLWHETLFLSVFAIGLFVLSMAKFKKNLG